MQAVGIEPLGSLPSELGWVRRDERVLFRRGHNVNRDVVLVGHNQGITPAASQQKALFVFAEVKLRHNSLNGRGVLSHQDSQTTLRSYCPAVVTPQEIVWLLRDYRNTQVVLSRPSYKAGNEPRTLFVLQQHPPLINDQQALLRLSLHLVLYEVRNDHHHDLPQTFREVFDVKHHQPVIELDIRVLVENILERSRNVLLDALAKRQMTQFSQLGIQITKQGSAFTGFLVGREDCLINGRLFA